MKKFKRKITVDGIEFDLQTSMYTNGTTTIKTLCNYNYLNKKNGFQINLHYEGQESLKMHLLNVENKIKCIAESINGWKTVSELLEQEGFDCDETTYLSE
tara:strand:- start:46 stop:345 length:300 start_codon:yes stop_codon:yes gene_type:complete